MHAVFTNLRNVVVEIEHRSSYHKIIFRGEDLDMVEFSLTYKFDTYSMIVTGADDNTPLNSNLLTDCRRLEATQKSVEATFLTSDHKRIKIKWEFVDRLD